MSNIKTNDKPVFYGIGHAIVDEFIIINEKYFPYPLTPKHPTHVEPKEMDVILQKLDSISTKKVKHSGGTTANILKTASALGASCSFSGTTGVETRKNNEETPIRDKNAIFFQKEMAKHKIEAQLRSGSCETGVFLLVKNKDASAILASPAAAKQIKPEQINEIRLSHSACVIIEGMQCMNHEVLQRVIELCLRYNKPLVIDIASQFAANIVGKYIPELSEILDIILFANENEYNSLKEVKPENYCYMTILKKGHKGSEIWYTPSESHYEISAIESSNIIDTTGAGDTFAGAFLYKWFLEQDATKLKEHLAFASGIATKTLENFGC